MKNSLFVLFVAVAIAFSMGAFAKTVHAQDAGYDPSAGYSDGGGYDPTAGGYDPYSGGGYDPYGGGYDPYAGGYDPYAGGYDPSSSCDSSCYSPSDYCNCDTPSYSYDTTSAYDTTSYDTYAQSYAPSYSYSTPTFYAPSAPHPVTYSAPAQQQQQQQQQQQAASVTPINITNTNTNTNINTAPVAQVTPQPVVQYVYPQNYSYPYYYNYPTYYQPTYYQPTYTQAPYCTITATNGANGYVTLSWSSSYATSGYISPSVGNVAPNGSTSLYTYGSNVYTLTVSGPGGTNSCRTQVYAPTTSVSLTQIPYTGFDFGPVGNAIYWMSLLAFAAAGAYLAFYFKGGALALAGNALGSFRKEEVTEKKEVVVPAPVVTAAPVKSPIQVNVFEKLPTSVETSTRDSMKMLVSKDGTPRIVIARN